MTNTKIILIIFILLNAEHLECTGNIPRAFYGCGQEFTIFLMDTYKTFCEAVLFCQLWKPGATLAMPKTMCINNVITELVRASGRRGFKPWVGAADMVKENSWTWIDGTPISGYSSWAKVEPNGRTYENCMQLFPDVYWNDARCEQHFPYVCQYDVSKTTSSYYKDIMIVRKTVDFDFAMNDCNSQGSRLVEITDEISFEAVRRFLGKRSRKKYWIGGNFTSKGWTWLSGTEFGFQKWLQDIPSIGGYNRCLAMTYDGFSDYDCDSNSFRYICETVLPHMLLISDEQPVILESESIGISCNASGYPIPVVQWSKDGEVVIQDVTHDVHQVIGVASSNLVIHNAGLMDGGKYYCIAVDTINNTKNTIKGSTFIKVVPHGAGWTISENSTESPNNNNTNEVIPDDDYAEDINGNLEPEQSNTTTNTSASQSALKYGEPCEKPTWILPVFLMLGLILIILSSSFALLLYQRYFKGQ